MKKVLITGGAGFIASSLAERLIEKDYFVVLVDNFLTGKKSNLPTRFRYKWKFIQCDVNNYKDIAAVMTAYSFDYVFHYAAVVGVQRTLNNPTLVLRDIDGIQNVLNLCKNTGVKRVFYSSSSEVYGEPVELPQNELTTPLNSKLPYAVVKNVGEAYCRSYKREYGLDYTIFRFFNTYGPKQSADFVMSKFLTAATKDEPITIYGDGEQTRTFCYIDDNVEATIAEIQRKSYVDEIVNIGNDQEVSILDLAHLIRDMTGSRSEIEFVPPLPEGDMTRRMPDIFKMKELLKRDLLPLGKGILKVIEEGKYLAHV